MRKIVLIAAMSIAAALGAGDAAEPTENREVIQLVLPDGSKVAAQLARTAQAQARGLMFRETMPADAGMLFVFAEDAPRTFWMKNTYISLDIIFLDADMKVRKIFHRVPRSNPEQPEAEVARVSAPASFVLELAAGVARSSRLKPGSVVKTSSPLLQKKASVVPVVPAAVSGPRAQ